MKPLEVHCRNRVLFVKMSIEDKGMGMRDYHLYDKNGLSFYVFRKSQGEWELAYGVLADDVREACIDALILRYDHDSPELFYKDGKRNVVRISAKKGGIWHVYVNTTYVASIQYDEYAKKFEYYLEAEIPLTVEHIEKYIGMIQRGEIKWVRER
ncbi:hypothetical protein OHD16_06780 [Sphingobacterium sp. ML3W]|uniref:hypothetical protein n=2 Tax=Sphingobacterium sp. ML3W TaxID=1538644 RepID=UPI00249C9EAD|nr:hypothetical protein [Sphingobacterium sp. ML3W]WFA79674.1 hypothetical protein OGI71_27020 [Sphingobacterium sp. ML3W]